MRNKIMRTMVIGVVVAVFCTALIGCGNDSKATQGTGETNEAVMDETISDKVASSGLNVEIPDSYEKENDSVSFKADVVVASEVREKGLQRLTASLQKPNPEKVLECLMGNTEVKEKNEEENNYWYVGANDESLTINNTSIGFANKFYVYVSNACLLYTSPSPRD